MRAVRLGTMCIGVVTAMTAAPAIALGGGSDDAKALEQSIEDLRREIRSTQNSIASAREESERLEGQLEEEATRVSSLLASRISGASQIFLSLDADLVSEVVKGFLNGYGGVKAAEGDTPAAHWELRGIRTRPSQDRLFVSGSYNVRVGDGECDGPVHGHLIYLERNLLKLSDMELRCHSHGYNVEVNVGANMPPIPLPIRVESTWTITPRDGVRMKTKSLKMLIPMQMELGATRVNVRTRAVQIKAVK